MSSICSRSIYTRWKLADLQLLTIKAAQWQTGDRTISHAAQQHERNQRPVSLIDLGTDFD